MNINFDKKIQIQAHARALQRWMNEMTIIIVGNLITSILLYES